MVTESPRGRKHARAAFLKGGALAASVAVALAAAPSAGAHDRAHSAHRGGSSWRYSDGHGANWRSNDGLQPDSLVVSGTVFPRDGVNLSVGQSLPFATNYGNKYPEPSPPVDAQAVADGQYPYVFNNDGPDGSFAVSTPINLWDVSLSGWPLGRIDVPTNEMTTSFSSKSELAINPSTNGQDLSFLGYNAPVGTFDASNSNTPGIIDPTNPDLAGPYFRVAGDLSSEGHWTFTETNSYTGDNGRAVLLNNADHYFYAAGNDNNGNYGKSKTPPIPPAILDATGAQTFPESFAPESAQTAAGGAPTDVLGNFDISWVPPNAADKPGKDTNFRGLTVYNNVVYYTKGSGSNGVNTVYFVDTAGACSQSDAVGIPASNAPLPKPGVTYNMCILRGFNQQPASTDTNDFPFGLWFANAHTLYVADEGNGNFGTLDPSNPYADAAAEQYAGLQKWVFNSATKSWQRAYTLQTGLDLGQPYTVPGYPTGNNDTEGGTGLPWQPATDGLRNISGHVNRRGTVTVYATTSTVSGSGDQGADPNKVVAVTDALNAKNAGNEKFVTIRPATYGVRSGGVAVLPSDFGAHHSGR